MHRLDVDLPASWVPVDPPRTDYSVGGVRVTLSVVAPAPEHPGEWMRVELKRRGIGHHLGEGALRREVLPSGWPALVGETTLDGDRALIVLMFVFLDQAATAVIEGPIAAVAAHRTEILATLGTATVVWGDPPLPLATLLDGATR